MSKAATKANVAARKCFHIANVFFTTRLSEVAELPLAEAAKLHAKYERQAIGEMVETILLCARELN